MVVFDECKCICLFVVKLVDVVVMFDVLCVVLVVMLFDYMVLYDIMVFDVLFVMLNGKIDWVVLVCLLVLCVGSDICDVLCGVLEMCFVEMWVMLFEFVLDEIGCDVLFFELGGYLLLVLWLMLVVKCELGGNVVFVCFMEWLIIVVFVVLLIDELGECGVNVLVCVYDDCCLFDDV